MREGFYKLQSNLCKTNNQYYDKFNMAKKKLISECLKRLFINKKKWGFLKLKSYGTISRLNKKVTIINTIIAGASKRNILFAWTQLIKKKGSKNDVLNAKI